MTIQSSTDSFLQSHLRNWWKLILSSKEKLKGNISSNPLKKKIKRLILKNKTRMNFSKSTIQSVCNYNKFKIKTWDSNISLQHSINKDFLCKLNINIWLTRIQIWEQILTFFSIWAEYSRGYKWHSKQIWPN